MKRKKSKRIYLICPVRSLKEEEKKELDAYVFKLEQKGYEVCLPYRDTNQIDEIGLRIVEEHIEDVVWADEIHIWWNAASYGSHVDLGQTLMAVRLMPEKKMFLINADKLEITPEKSYTNVLLAKHYGLNSKNTLEDLKKAKKKAE